MKLPKTYALFLIQGKWQRQEKDWGEYMMAAEVKEFFKAFCKKHGISVSDDPKPVPAKVKDAIPEGAPAPKKRGRPNKIRD